MISLYTNIISFLFAEISHVSHYFVLCRYLHKAGQGKCSFRILGIMLRRMEVDKLKIVKIPKIRETLNLCKGYFAAQISIQYLI